MNPLHYYTKRGKEKIKLHPKPFASGGEGNLYRIGTPYNLQRFVAKIYHRNKLDAEKQRKIEYLIAHPPIDAIQQNSNLIWPYEALVDRQGKCVGFIMPFIKAKKLETLSLSKLPKKLGKQWSRFDRKSKQSLELRLKLCYNIATIVHTIHTTGSYRIVDLKPDNILVQPHGIVSLVDIDSIEVIKNGEIIFPATVITPEFTPPEYYKKYAPKNIPTQYESWDLFSLGVVFYKLLFGIHPFAATAGPPYDNVNNLHEKIKHGLFVHNVNLRSTFRVVPPPHREFDKVDQPIRDLFYSCFVDGHNMPELRPSASEWGTTIRSLLTGESIVASRKNTDQWLHDVWTSWYHPTYKMISEIKQKSQKQIAKINKFTALKDVKFPQQHRVLSSHLIRQELEELRTKKNESKFDAFLWIIAICMGIGLTVTMGFIGIMIFMSIVIIVSVALSLDRKDDADGGRTKAALNFFNVYSPKEFEEVRGNLLSTIEHQKKLINQRVKGLKAKIEQFKKNPAFDDINGMLQRVHEWFTHINSWETGFEQEHKQKLLELKKQENEVIDTLYATFYKDHIEQLGLKGLKSDVPVSYRTIYSKIYNQYSQDPSTRKSLSEEVRKHFDHYMKQVHEIEAKFNQKFSAISIEAKTIAEEQLTKGTVINNIVNQQYYLMKASDLPKEVKLFEMRRNQSLKLIENSLDEIEKHKITEQWLKS